MLNGLSTGGFELQSDTSAKEMVDRLLGMLNQYLISHQKLQLDNDFKVYIKILSSEHAAQKRLTKAIVTKKRKINSRNYVGGRRDQNIFSQLWGIDIKSSCNDNLTGPFFNKCLLTCAILGKLQNDYLKSKEKSFLTARMVNSTVPQKKKYACKLLIDHLTALIDILELPANGPYELQATLKLLSQHWKCQFFVFAGISQAKSKLSYWFPSTYDDSLMPIYLYQPHGENHIIYIQNIDSYYRHNGKLCLGCMQTFKGVRYRHFCKSKRSCFACHRHLQTPATYIHSKLERHFCNVNITPEIFTTCERCNCKILSQSCLRAHKLLCYSKGYFGWFCDQCQKFSYAIKNLTSDEMKKRHVCGSLRNCRYCFFPQEQEHHLCLIRKEKCHNYHSRLGFCQLQLFGGNELLMALIYREENERGFFAKYSFFSKKFNVKDTKDNTFSYDYMKGSVPKKQVQFKLGKPNSKRSFDFMNNYEKLCREEESIERNLLLHFFEKNDFATYIVTDDTDIIMVIKSFYINLISHAKMLGFS